MYAIVRERGQQFKVREGEVVRIPRMASAPGAEVTFSEVLLLGAEGGVKIGTPTVAGAKVTGVLEDQVKGEKTISRRRIWTNKHVVRRGHRAQYSLVRIKKIQG